MKKNLEYIIKVAEYGNINKAAQKLYITPSALSKYIITKEKELGVKLFDRSGKKFKLTYAGEKYVDWAKKIIHMQNSMNRELESIAEDKIGIMHFGFQLMQSKAIFSSIIPEFKKVYEAIDIVLESTYSTNLLKMVEDGLIDFALTSHHKKDEGFVYSKVSEIEIVVVVPKGHQVIKSAIYKKGFKYPWIDIKQLKSETFVGLYEDQEPRRVMDTVFQDNDMSPKISMQVHTTELTLLSVANNFGVTIAYDQPAKSDDYKDQVELLSFGSHPIKRDISIIHKTDYSPSRYVALFFDICKNHFTK